MECPVATNPLGFFIALGIICLILFLWWDQDRKMRKEFEKKYQLVLDQLKETGK